MKFPRRIAFTRVRRVGNPMLACIYWIVRSMEGRSTKRNEAIEEADTSGTSNVREQDVYTKVADIPGLTGTIYTNQTGQFTITSRSGNKYVMVMVPIDSNAILISPMKNRKDVELQWAHLELLHRAK